VNVWLGERWLTVVGVLRPVTLDPDLDSAADDRVDETRDTLAATPTRKPRGGRREPP
jgi:hypothetical protein